jgi:hypothetical protein
MQNERLKQAKALIQQGPTDKFRWQMPPPFPGEHACERPEPILPQVCTRLRSEESKLPNLYLPDFAIPVSLVAVIPYQWQ